MDLGGERFAELAEPQLKGQAAEAIIKAAFIVREYTVLEPWLRQRTLRLRDRG